MPMSEASSSWVREAWRTKRPRTIGNMYSSGLETSTIVAMGLTIGPGGFRSLLASVVAQGAFELSVVLNSSVLLYWSYLVILRFLFRCLLMRTKAIPMRATTPTTEPTVTPTTVPFEIPISPIAMLSDTVVVTAVTVEPGEAALVVDGGVVDSARVEELTTAVDESVCPGARAKEPVVTRFVYATVISPCAVSQYKAC